MAREYFLSYSRATNSRETGFSGVAISRSDGFERTFNVSVNVLTIEVGEEKELAVLLLSSPMI